MADYFSITEAADELSIPPRVISDLLYQRKLDPRQCLVKGGRKFLPAKMLTQIERILDRKAK